MRNRLISAGLGVLCLSTVLVAHHSLKGEYDLDRLTQIKGVVTEVQWVNPHVRYYVDVADAAGLVSTWNVEALAPHAMIKSGFAKTTLGVGDRVTVSGYSGKNLSPFIKKALAMTRIALPDGKTVNVDPTGWMQSDPALPK